MGALGFLQRLPPLRILREDLRPGRADEDAPIVAAACDGPLEMRRPGEADEVEIACDVRDAAVEEDQAIPVQMAAMGGEVVRQHELGIERRVCGRQGRPADRLLVADDGAAGFGRDRMARRRERGKQGRLAGAGAAGEHEEAIGGVVRHGSPHG